MKDLQFSYLQTTARRSLEGLAILQTCRKIDGEIVTSGPVVANGCINALDQDRFGLKLRVEIFGNFRWTGQILVLFLAQPSERIGNVQPDPIGLRNVRAAAMYNRS